ncbi:hypothetical protein [Sabulicella rubraurantiaca]|uniref:hypothetical protein n=1 Tax=Sabulicella rubraurantiaca TaxID=2811429 RepID=UPI001A95E8E9|nr:hypothetical protein [Sabulicella rubraurantiaca]
MLPKFFIRAGCAIAMPVAQAGCTSHPMADTWPVAMSERHQRFAALPAAAVLDQDTIERSIPMTKIRNTLALFAVAAAILGSGAAGAQSCPCMTRGAEDSSIDYGSAAPNNVVGGGNLVARFEEENRTFTYLEPRFEQQAQTGLVPHVFTSGDGRAEVVWVPSGTLPSALATMGGDGSLLRQRGLQRRLASR